MFALCDVNSFTPPAKRSFVLIYVADQWWCYQTMMAALSRVAPRRNSSVSHREPYFKQKERFRRSGVVCFSSNYELYADMSNRVMTTLEEMVPRVEIYSIDEAFVI